jgi:hypothetical protein
MAELKNEPFSATRGSQPRFLLSAELHAADARMTASEILEDDLESLNDSQWPTTDCLGASEIQVYVHGRRLEDERLNHLRNCEFCSLLVGLKSEKADTPRAVQSSAAT